MLPIASSTTLGVIRSSTIQTFVSGTCSPARLPRSDHLKPASLFDILEKHVAFNAAYNSGEREAENASTCLEGTREDVIRKISAWVQGNTDFPICWLQRPAGSGKSTVAHTIAKQCADNQKLAFSFFFSGGKLDRSDIPLSFSPHLPISLLSSFRRYNCRCRMLSRAMLLFPSNIWIIRSRTLLSILF
jgi:hypothetical protein